jgi:anti-anti-sigma factor
MATTFQHLRCRTEDDVLIATLLPTHIQGDELAEALRNELHAAVDECHAKKLVIDFAQVKYLASPGLRPLLSIHRKLRTFGGSMVLCNMATEVAEVLAITRLITTSRASTAPFEKVADVAEALARLRGDRAK